MVVGDWGRQGEYHQQDVADVMNQYSNQYDARFIISTGDNFYTNGVRSVNDPLWQTCFENIYHWSSLQKDWYVVLGNHDYHGNPQAEIDYSKISRRWNLPSRYYAVMKKIDDKDSIRFLFIDTSPFLTKYHAGVQGYDLNIDQNEIQKQDTTKQLQWIDKELTNSRAQWNIVVGHHPIYSADFEHGNTDELVAVLDPILRKHHVQFYICGHAHDMQHLKAPGDPTEYVVSGAGSETRPTGHGAMTQFGVNTSGFAFFSATDDSIQLNFIDYQGNVLYSAKRGK
ncbi:MAG: purple acid phosphatase family protein [Chitinophagales bacterium]